MPMITCDCGKYSVEVNCDELDWDSNTYEKHSGSMGPEVEHYASFEDVCPRCEKIMHVLFTCWEYPPMIVQTTDIQTSNCTSDEKCCPDFEASEED